MKLSGVSQKVFLDRYSMKDKDGGPIEKTPDEMWKRVAKAGAALEKKSQQKKWERSFYEAMKDFKYIPGGRILAGAGTGYDVTYYNCFVIPSPKDSRGGILETLKNMVEIMAHGGGVGINLSSLRPRGERVKKVNGFSSGPCNWAELFSLATKDIIQQGGTRRGALMLMLHDWHPDIEEFITVKEDLSRINGANLSVCASDKFMEAVKADADWPLVFPDVSDPEYDEKWDGDIESWKKMGKKVIVKKIVKAAKIWDLIAKAAWASAEPGLVFMERYNKMHNNYYWNRINCVNPCGEEGLPAWGVCNLGSINLSALIDGNDITKPGTFKFDELKELVHSAVRFQDNVVQMDPYIFDGIRKTQLEGERRIGLGTMGLGDTLIKMHIRYGSEEALEFIEKVYKIIAHEAYRASIEVAKEKGSFPKFDADKFVKSGFMKTLPKDIRDDVKKHGIRNSVLLMQAPTGSTSLMANTTSGIEPVYEFEFIRRDRLGEHVIRHHLWQEYYERNKEAIDNGTLKRPSFFCSANDLSPEDHVMVQAVIQRYVDASISKTVNAPAAHTVEDVKRLYTLAYDQGLKGIAYMRDGSRMGVLSRKEEKKDEKKQEQPPAVQLPAIKPRPMVVQGSTYRMHTPVGTAYITINSNGEGDPHEVFINLGKAGTDVYAMAEGLGRIISLFLRVNSNLPPTERVKKIIDELQDIGGGRVLGFGKERVKSLPDAIAKVLNMHFTQLEQTRKLQEGSAASANKAVTENDEDQAKAPELTSQTEQPSLMQESVNKTEVRSRVMFDICPDCGQALLAHEEGCKKCYGCGYSAC
ncbi:MAG: adenosylcobalamin-dependent ribonucleoside-diphosphate reductase [Patescibacteria group bacterium]